MNATVLLNFGCKVVDKRKLELSQISPIHWSLTIEAFVVFN